MTDLIHYLHILLKNRELTTSEAKHAVEAMLTHTHPEHVSAIISILKYRGETVNEIRGVYEALADHSSKIQMSTAALDIVGTGGDFSNTVNISTGSAILAAACGIPIVKHGNRSVSSQCGSADVLEALGVDIEMSIEKIQACFNQLNIAFLYAPLYHPALRKLKSIRKSLSMPSIFNLVCPLLNPSHPEYALIGVTEEHTLEKMSDVILQTNRFKHALVFSGCGLDELTTLGNMTAYHIRDGKKKKINIHPHSLGFSTGTLKELQGGDADTNAALLKDALSGDRNAISDAFILNAGAALMVFNKTTSLEEGIEIAKSTLIQGKAIDLLNQWICYSREIVIAA